MSSWDERFRAGEYPTDPDPSPVLRRHVGSFPDGRALDVATGTGRNAVFLAEQGYDVDALDRSRVGLEVARGNAAERGVADRIEWIQADAAAYEFPASAYDVVTVSYYRVVDRLPDVVEALAPGGVVFVEHHLRSTDEVEVGPSGDRHRFGANELLHACLGLTVLYFETVTEDHDGRRSATTRIVARNSHGTRQSYPTVER